MCEDFFAGFDTSNNHVSNRTSHVSNPTSDVANCTSHVVNRTIEVTNQAEIFSLDSIPHEVSNLAYQSEGFDPELFR